VPTVSIRKVDPEGDLAGLVLLNRSTISTCRHYDREARAGTPASWNELSRWERWQHGGPWFDPKLLTLHLQIMKESASVVLVAKEGETVLGELELVFDFDDPQESRAHLARMAVNQTGRHEGVTKLLVRHARRLARSRGCHRITTSAEDQASQTFYESQGFRKIGSSAELTKHLAKSSKQASEGALQAIRLSWDSRPQPPHGFKMVIGNDYSPRYVWTSLRQMNSVYTLLDVQAPLPSLWLLRQDEAEALTVDHEQVRLWLSTKGCDASDFLRAALERTEQLSMSNAVTRLTAIAFTPRADLLKQGGYAVQKERPYLAMLL